MPRSPHHSRNKRKNELPPLIHMGSGFCVGLDFMKNISTVVDKDSILTVNPNVITRNNSEGNTIVILDYSHVGSHKSGDSQLDSTNKSILKLFFEATISKGETVTITNGQYLNELLDPLPYDISGTYTFDWFDVNTFTVGLTKISIDNQSPSYDFYDKKYFVNGSIQWSSTSSTIESKTSTTNEIINRLGSNESNNSFFKVLSSSIKAKDLIELQINNSTILTFTVEKFIRDTETGIERIIVTEPIPNPIPDLFGTRIFVALKRRVPTRSKVKRSSVPIVPVEQEGMHKMSNGKWMIGETHKEGERIMSLLAKVKKLNARINTPAMAGGPDLAPSTPSTPSTPSPPSTPYTPPPPRTYSNQDDAMGGY